MNRDFPPAPGLPPVLARYGNAPVVLDAFQRFTELYDAQTSLSPIEREVVIFAVARKNGCELCVAYHTMLLGKADTAPALLAQLRGERAYVDERHAALDAFARSALDRAGDVDRHTWERFRAAGYTHQQALEVVLGIAAYTLSTFANRLLEIPLDGPLRAFA